ncbi:MAG: sigma-70 family RNA polymerase sigma factor [Thermaerobacter sp.]|nr:sigma-70 family RNA polymerase sigma factor [Thermaerobacter sp.]
MDEAELIRRAKVGDRNAAGALCTLHWRTVYALMFARLGDRAEAEDVTQEAFMRLWGAFARFEGETIGPYLRTIALNLARNRLRDTGRHPQEPLSETPPPDPGPSVEQEVVTAEIRGELLAALAQLMPEHREVLTLRLMDGRSVTEAAQILRRTPEAVRALQYRALQKLRAIVQDAARVGEV